jgi:hypothetical protein
MRAGGKRHSDYGSTTIGRQLPFAPISGPRNLSDYTIAPRVVWLMAYGPEFRTLALMSM